MYAVRTLIRVLVCVFAILALMPQVHAAGPAGHYYIAKRAAERMIQMPDADELGDLLKDPSCLNAFCNGAIAPDLECVCAQAHYGKTTKIPMALLDTAENAYEAAAKLPDSDSTKTAKLREAEKAMCFGLGWISHMATDLAVHPPVNARTGDCYEYNDAGGKRIHAAAEVQFTQYLLKTLKKPDDKITFDIPYWLMTKATGKSQQDLQTSVGKMRMKIIGELGLAGQVTIPLEELRKEWQGVLQQSMNDTVSFIMNPESLEDWDLDCGRISTDNFKALRAECVQINDGKVPQKWGKEYMNWWEQVKNLQPQPRHQRLVELIKGEQAYQAGRKEVLVRNISGGYIWVNDKEIKSGTNNIVQVPSSGLLKIRVLTDNTYRALCIKREYRGENARVITQNPFELHYTSTLYGRPFEHRTFLLRETFRWNTYDTGGKVSSSGVHPGVTNDVLEWKVPFVKKTSWMSSKSFVISLESDCEWSQFQTGNRPEQVNLTTDPRMSLKIEVEAE